jgi:hypothetical protein
MAFSFQNAPCIWVRGTFCQECFNVRRYSLKPKNTLPGIREVDIQPGMLIEDVEADQLEDVSSGRSGTEVAKVLLKSG